ncbi:hypothetical protein IEQ34_019839 [Dendrobium chrysotoxum]|uniref:Uncharacterized protein n=1 Tax=Dendrobium chrysotoxum TaxID=161865 RepID=A0AAV7G9Q8_DENCH|nr:hypothetical protein IEQ34_019839 [Dendrobium chrysotoxum]
MISWSDLDGLRQTTVGDGLIQYVDARSGEREFMVNLDGGPGSRLGVVVGMRLGVGMSRSGSLEMRFVYSSMDLDGGKRMPDLTLEASVKRIVARFGT